LISSFCVKRLLLYHSSKGDAPLPQFGPAAALAAGCACVVAVIVVVIDMI
jgi:hypothetical protein